MIADDALNGLLAGAAGTAVLNATTYADMAVRDRPASELPAKMVTELAQRAHVAVPQGNRQTGFGALLGYADGLGAGVLFGLVRPRLRALPWYYAAVGLGILTMVMSEGTATAMKQTDPRTWGFAGWASDLVPRCVYGAVTCLTFDRLSG